MTGRTDSRIDAPVAPDSGSLDLVDVPDHVVADAKAAFGRRDPGKLATLVFDSLVDEGGPADDHVLRFEHALLHVNVRVASGAVETSLSGSVEPATVSSVELQMYRSDPPVIHDVVDGRFTFEGIGHGLIRLNFTGPTGAGTVHTDWFRV